MPRASKKLLGAWRRVAWQHINFFGRYEFRKGLEAINLREIVRELGQLPVRLASGE